MQNQQSMIVKYQDQDLDKSELEEETANYNNQYNQTPEIDSDIENDEFNMREDYDDFEFDKIYGKQQYIILLFCRLSQRN